MKNRLSVFILLLIFLRNSFGFYYDDVYYGSSYLPSYNPCPVIPSDFCGYHDDCRYGGDAVCGTYTTTSLEICCYYASSPYPCQYSCEGVCPRFEHFVFYQIYEPCDYSYPYIHSFGYVRHPCPYPGQVCCNVPGIPYAVCLDPEYTGYYNPYSLG